MAWTKGKTALVAIAVVFVLVLLTAVLRRISESRPVKLPDGSEVRVYQMSFGKTHRFVDGPPWQQMLAGLPTNITARLGIRPKIRSTVEDTLVVWFQWELGTNTFPFPQWLRIIDSNGLASGAVFASSSINLSNKATVGFDLTSFPRDEPTLLLELRAPENRPGLPIWRDLANFRIRNPCFGKQPPHPMTALPTSTFADGEQFTLLAINTGLSATGALAGHTQSNQWTEFLFRIGTNEPAQRTTDPQERGPWLIKSIGLRDSFGNFIPAGHDPPYGRIFPLGDGHMIRTDDGIALIPGAIWPSETWNVRAVFDRWGAASFDAAQSWTPKIHINETGERVLLDRTGRVEGCEIRPSIEQTSNSVALSVGFSRKSSGYDWHLLHVEDQRGTNVLWGWSRGIAPIDKRIELRAPAESTDLKITFGVTHPVTVELSGKPSILRENVARWAPKE